MDMTFREKVDYLRRDLGRRGLRDGTISPPLFRLCWWLGWPIRPPHFLPFLRMTFLSGGVFAVSWGSVMAAFLWSLPAVPWLRVAAIAGGTGFLFGVFVAAYYRYQAKRLALPRWRRYPVDYDPTLARR